MEEGVAEALVLNALSGTTFIRQLLSLPLQENLSRHPSCRQLFILEEPHLLLPAAFSDLSVQLASRYDLRRLFPRIVASRMHCQSPHSMRAAVSWVVPLGPSLTILGLHVGQGVSYDILSSSLRAIRGKFPQLGSLDLAVDVRLLSPGQMFDIALQIVALCDSVQSLTTLRLPLVILEHAWRLEPDSLSQHPALQDLSLSSGESSQLSKLFPTRAGGFHALRTLRLQAPLPRCEDVILALSKNVSRLHLECEHASDPQTTSQSLRQIAGHLTSETSRHYPHHRGTSQLSSTNLDRLFQPQGIPAPVLACHLTELDIIVRQSTPEAAHSFSFIPLLSARSLQTLSIQYPYSLSYTMQDFADMLSSWHSLRILSLNPRPPRGISNLSALPPLSILSVVAHSGPSLRELRVLLDGNTHRMPVPQHTWAPNYLRLDLGYSVGICGAEAVVEVVKYIRKLFTSTDFASDDCSAWVAKVAESFDTIESTT